jgi:ABC-type sugar transport system substrate-binding protein
MKKRAFCGAVAVTAMIALVGASSSLSAGSRSAAVEHAGASYNVWFVDGFSFVPAWQKMEQQFKREAAKLGDKATVVGMSALDPAKMVSDMDQAIAAHANAILFCDVDPKVFTAEIAKARKAGIVVTTIGCVDKLSNYSIGTDNLAYGKFAADVVGKKLGGSGDVGFDGTTRSTPNQVLQVKGFKQETGAKYPGIKVVAWEEGKGNTATDTTVITAMIQANPSLKAVICITSTCPPAAQAALTAAGKKPGDLFFLGIDHDPATIAALKSGWVNETISQCWFDAGPFALDLMQAKLDGHGSATQSWPMPTQVVTQQQLPYPGCPAKLIPTVKP